jgi:CheY-like chemotaxis protein
MAHAQAAGINALVTKPWQGRELAQTIRRVLDQQVSLPHAPSEPERMED